MRYTRLLTLLSIIALGLFTVFALFYSTPHQHQDLYSSPPEPPVILEDASLHHSVHGATAHPIQNLVKDAQQDFEKVKARQSRSLIEAVKEYRRRYGMPPPPNFDKWYDFATRRGVQLIDEYNTIYDSLLPFWGLKPSTIRARVMEALGFDNALIGMTVRNGGSPLIQGGGQWQQEATIGMMKSFMKFLPDMDLAFNIHDEPRIVVPHDDLTRLLSIAKQENIAAAAANKSPINHFSRRPSDLNDGKMFPEVKTTRFNRFAHQPVWFPSRLSCSPDSPTRALEDGAADETESYMLGELGLVFNSTAFSDICLTPSLRQTFGFFDRPNAFDVSHDLIPIFSQSKISSFQDILYPSPWYWFGKVTYEEDNDIDWQDKTSKIYWRGSTTGGFSRDGGWRRQHRQRIVRRINAPDTATILENTGDASVPKWASKEVRRQEYRQYFDVKFSHIGQCDPNDCDAQREFFEVVEPAEQRTAWISKFLLDMDGNAFSGRFYAFLKSKSLVFKMAIFREWHQEWLKPWLHFIPLSLRGDEYVETVRYFADEEEGKADAPRLAMDGRDWANKVLRNEDFEAWFFRLLLEYGRVVDDNRESIGYSGP